VPIVIFVKYLTSAIALGTATGWLVGDGTSVRGEVIDAILAGQSAVLTAGAFSCGWRAECHVFVLDEVDDPAERAQCHHRGTV
jgi:hypothetical protein